MIAIEDIKYGDIVVVEDAGNKNICIVHEIDTDNKTFSCLNVALSVKHSNYVDMLDCPISVVVSVNADEFTAHDRGEARIVMSLYDCHKKIFDKTMARLLGFADGIKDKL